jgi:hypothetical protein
VFHLSFAAVATLNGRLLEGKRCKAKMEHIKSKFKGVAAYLKANANKWKKKDVLEKLEQKKEGAQARAMARGLSRAERKIARRNAEVSKLKAEDAAAKAALAAKAKLLRGYKRAMRSKLRKIKKVLWTKAQGNNKVWLRKALRKCHAAEVGLHHESVCVHICSFPLSEPPFQLGDTAQEPFCFCECTSPTCCASLPRQRGISSVLSLATPCCYLEPLSRGLS